MNVRTRTQPAEEAPGRERLTRDRIIETALRVMDDEGLEAVTMRRIGRELGVEAMSLYNHVEDKDDILEGVTERVMNEFEFPDSTGRWAEDARAMSREWRRLLALHPSVCQLLAERHKPLEGLATYRAMDSALGVLRRAGLSDRDAAQAAIAERSVFNVIHQAHVIKVDFIVRKDSEYRRTEFARQRRSPIEGHELALVAPEDLIISKLDWMRETRSEVQLADVRNLLRSVPDLDKHYLAHWTERLGLGALYRGALGG